MDYIRFSWSFLGAGLLFYNNILLSCGQRRKKDFFNRNKTYICSENLAILEKGGGRTMAQWWAAIPAFERIFWSFAIPFTVIFLIQLILTMVGVDFHDSGLDAHDGVDLNHDADVLSGFRLFTLRNFIIFFTGFGWAGIFGVHAGFTPFVTVLLAFVVGLMLMVGVASLFFFMTKLTQSGNIDLANALNTSGRVYLPIPGKRSGIGQVQITVQGAVREVEAITDEETLATGTPITVVEVVNDDILVVKRS